MRLIYRANDGSQFDSEEECLKYEGRLSRIIREFTNIENQEKIAGANIAEKMGVSREFLPCIEMLDDSLQVLDRLHCARRLAHYLDDFIALGSWLKTVSTPSDAN